MAQIFCATFSARDYAEVRFADHIKRFERLADVAEALGKGAELAPTDRVFLDECCEKDAA